ncbi:hypothetical protein [Kosakonia cowanii]|uniref:hypothetical protein n=1 Tax=Kosakonia cowanii TaxID=208223 RepID=UPI0022DF7931|nr:hypothetical protein [Kosakonia cowanii]
MNEKDMINLIKNHNWKEKWLDFAVYSFERNKLIITASDDFSYYHTLEIILDNPSYISGVVEWSSDLDEEFIKLLTQFDISSGAFVLEFYSDSELKFKVVAEKMMVNFDTVFYYKREGLKSGERLASWVK